MELNAKITKCTHIFLKGAYAPVKLTIKISFKQNKKVIC